MTAPSAWDIHENIRVWVGGHQIYARRALKGHLAGARRPALGPIDAAFLTPMSVEEAVYFADKLLVRLVDDGALWVVYPRPGSSRSGEFSGSREALLAGLSSLDLIASEAITVNDDFLAQLFRRPPPL